MATTRIIQLVVACLLAALPVQSQSNLDSIISKIDPQKFASSIKENAEKLEDKLIAKSMKVLSEMQKQEEKIYQKVLSTKDSVSARVALGEIKSKYNSLKD